MPELTSRERLQRTLRLQPADYEPCSFVSFTALRRRCRENMYELALAEKALGLDAFLFIPTLSRPQRPEHPELRGLPVRFHPSVVTRERREEIPGQPAILHKEYTTPAGKLRTSVRMSDDWPHGDHIPFVDDFQVPRAIKPLLSGDSRELEALQFLLTPPSPEDIAQFQAEAERAQAFALEHGVLLAGGWGVGADMSNWLCGFENLMLLGHDQPAFVERLFEMIHLWNRQRMVAVLAGKVDLFIYRAWYEGCDFVSPGIWRKAILPRLQADAALAHEHGAKFGYICSSGILPLLGDFLDAGIDVLIGVDPVQGTKTDLAEIKRRTAGHLCLWGGVSGAVTVEMGEEAEVRAAVRLAIEALGPGGFILSPVDNITVDAPRTWQNIGAFIDEWKLRRSNGGAAPPAIRSGAVANL
ncbi:MAG TPA: uroporphyrinogen decarboxylase family protein [Terriglobia bacterium]|nr:uroporphyrinogen decarboxylase family protein [Terriglobia bacterium]